MDRRTRNVFALAFLAVVLVAGGAAILLGGSSPRDSPPPGLATVVGVVVGVDGEGLEHVRTFDLRITDGTVLTFGLDDLENGAEFPPGHLAEHQVTAQPVQVWYRAEEDPPQAIRLEDAP